MSHEILIADLKRKGEAKIKAIWQSARDEAEALKTKYSEELQARIEASEKDELEMTRSISVPILQEIRDQLALIYSEAEKELADRCFKLAEELLHEFRDENYENLFGTFVEELPDAHWQKIWVNHQDTALASTFFPEVEVMNDDEIIGGFKISADDGNLFIINTLENILEKIWPYLFPDLLKEIKEDILAETAE